MTPERWQEVKHLYHAALEAEPSRRAALLQSADPEVRSEVESLLSASGSTTSPLEREVLSHAGALLGDEMETETQAGGHDTLGQYQILTLLGRGGMGEVYLAHDPKLGRDVAIKTLPNEFGEDSERLSRFRREARVLASLNHPNIAAIYGLEESGGVSFLILELVQGETLAGILKRTGAFSMHEALRVMGQVAEALEAAHGKGITHRDIKPANIKVTPEGRVKVLDFGLAKVLHTEAAARTANAGLDTETGRILGTPRYMSPEQARGQEVDRRTDIWAFGCLLFELLTAKHALSGETVSDIIAAILEREPDYASLPPDTPVQVRRLVQQCLVKDRDQRLQDIAEARRAIEAAREHPRRQFISRRRLAIAAGASAVAAVPVALNIDGLRDRWFTVPGIRSLAVLPLANLSGNPDEEYFSDGMTESLITDLAKIGALKVISRTSVMSYKGTRKPLREIARELGVDAVLEGSAVRSGNRIRITVQLIDASTDQHVWAESYDRDFGDALVLQSEVARSVAQKVRAQLTPQEQTRLRAARKVNPAAHDAYLKGLFQRGSTREDFDKAQRYFDLALQQDPDYAPAYAGIARVWGGRQQYGFATPQEAGPRLVSATEKALALDDSLAEVHCSLGRMKTWTLWDFAGGEASFRRAIEIDPNYPDPRVFYARLLNFLKRPAEAMLQIERALELDPHNSFFRAMYAVDLSFVGRYDEAILQARRAYTEDPDGMGETALRIAFVGKGMLKEALEVQIARIVKMRRDLELAGVLKRWYDQGKYREAARAGAELLEQRARKGAFVPGGQIAVLYCMAGFPEKELEYMERAAEQRDPNALGVRHLARNHPEIEGTPRFQALLRRIGLP